MRTAVALTALLLTLTISTSCSARSDNEQPSVQATVNQQAAPTTTPTVPPTAAPTPLTSAAATPGSPNVALLATTRVSSGEESEDYATDADPETVWNAQDFPVQWISIAWDGLYLVERIELVVAQAPPGPTTHVLWIDNGSGVRTQFRQLSDIHTEDGQTITVEFNPPRPAKEFLIQTIDSPSWVAWREIRAIGQPMALHSENGTHAPMRLEKFLDQLVLPVQVTHAQDGSGRVFVVEQQGRIKIVKNGVANDDLFLDISKRVNCCEERGLFNVAFPPSFHASQQFYVSYSNSNNDTVISRFSTTDDPDVADPASEEILLIVDQPHIVHNGGRLAFGPRDGFLYVGMGDGGSDGPPVHFPQEPALLLGKILRIDVESGVEPYAIPPSNPFVADESFRDEIWALGLRNPWGFAFDDQTGELYIPDTGHNDREELNVQSASSGGGENYGWPTIEGTRCPRFENLPVPCSQAGMFVPPVAEYDHTRGCAIVGGVVYRGNDLPQLRGSFLFADFCRGDIWALRRTLDSVDSKTGLRWQSALIGNAGAPVSSIGEDEDGNVYVTGYPNGTIYIMTAN